MQSIINFFSSKNESRNRSRNTRPTLPIREEREGATTSRSSHLNSQPTSTHQTSVRDLHDHQEVVPYLTAEPVSTTASSVGSSVGIARSRSSSGSKLNKVKQVGVSLRSHKHNPFLFRRDVHDNLVMPSDELYRRRGNSRSPPSTTSHDPFLTGKSHDSDTSRQHSRKERKPAELAPCVSSLSSFGSARQTESEFEVMSQENCKSSANSLPLDFVSGSSDTPETRIPDLNTPTFSFSSSVSETPDKVLVDVEQKQLSPKPGPSKQTTPELSLDIETSTTIDHHTILQDPLTDLRGVTHDHGTNYDNNKTTIPSMISPSSRSQISLQEDDR